MTGVFGSFITDWEVEQAVVSHLREWMPDYLPNARRHGEAMRDEAYSDFPLPRSYEVTPRDPDHWPEDQLPAFLIVATGQPEKPRRDGDGVFRATFSIGVGSICSAGDAAVSKQLADLYWQAAAGLLLDKPSLGGFALGTTFLEGSQNDWLISGRDRTIASKFCVFGVEVDHVLEVTGGPSDHLEDPDTDPGDRPTPLTHELELEKA